MATGKEVIEILPCWRCLKLHPFVRVREAAKLRPMHAKYSNKLYSWSSMNCSEGGSMLEAFMPGEQLVLSAIGNRS
jgi:hypothetical protein